MKKIHGFYFTCRCLLMVFAATISVYSENHVQYTGTLGEQNSDEFNSKSSW
jgi:hypothetical protein